MELAPNKGIALNQSGVPSQERIEHAARELESQFARMLIKSMRDATPGDPFGGERRYQDMHDEQLAKELTRGRGLGLQPAIIRQLQHSGAAASAPAPGPMPLPSAFGSGLPLTPASRGASLGVDSSLPMAPSRSGTSMPGGHIGFPQAPPPAQASGPRVAMAYQSTQACGPDELDCSSPESFVASIWPVAQRTAEELGVSPRALVAQAALETNWGKSIAGTGGSSNNIFGIKAGGRWSGNSTTSLTHEFVNGRRRQETASFRAYATVNDSFRDYARLIRTERYEQALAAGNDVSAYANALQRAGYATDPDYASKITSIAESAVFDRAVTKITPNFRG